MNNKGMTLVELIMSFALASVIVVLLINVLLILKDVYYNSSLKSELIITQSGLSNQINKKMISNNLLSYNNCGDNCYDFTFTDETLQLNINKETNTITFGKTKYTYPPGVTIGDIEITKENYSTYIGNDSLFILRIPVEYNDMEEDFGINIVYPYKSNTSQL